MPIVSDAMLDGPDLDLLSEDNQDEQEGSSQPFEASREEEDLQRQKFVSELRDATQDREERKRYARLAYRLTVGWLAAIVLVVILQGLAINQPWVGFHLSDGVLITFIGTNTASVVGVLVVVVRYLFPRR